MLCADGSDQLLAVSRAVNCSNLSVVGAVPFRRTPVRPGPCPSEGACAPVVPARGTCC